jgi:hypothetical protein
MGSAVFSWQIPVSKEVRCLTLLNHVLTAAFSAHGLGDLGLLLVLNNDGTIERGGQGQMSQWAVGSSRVDPFGLGLQNPK